jgi:hypothetical protein
MISKRKSFRRAIPAFGLALLASLALGAVAAGSASAATQHWYVGGTKLAEGTPTAVAMNGTAPFFVAWKIAGLEFEVKCTTQKGGGTIENPVGGGAGVAAGTQPTLSGCTVVRGGKQCSVTDPISISAQVNNATEFEAKPAVKFAPAGTVFFELWIGGTCPWNGSFNFNGSVTSIANNATSSLEFTKASSALFVGGNKATLVGTSKLETTGGATVTVAP